MIDYENRWFNRLTKFMLWRSSRLILIAISLSATIFIVYGVFHETSIFQIAIDILLALMNIAAMGLNIWTYDRAFHCGK